MNQSDMRTAYSIRYGRETGTGNALSLRNALQRAFPTDAPRAPAPGASSSS